METVQIEQWVLAIQQEETKMAYALNGFRCMSEECVNFVQASTQIKPIVLSFADMLGIDLAKPSRLQGHRLDGDLIMYTGQYHIMGKVLEGELNGWDLVFEQYCFSLTDEYTAIPLMMDEHVIEISFEAVLPWVLSKVKSM